MSDHQKRRKYQQAAAESLARSDERVTAAKVLSRALDADDKAHATPKDEVVEIAMRVSITCLYESARTDKLLATDLQEHAERCKNTPPTS